MTLHDDDRDPLELRVLGMLPKGTITLPSGVAIATADGRWGDLTAGWNLLDGPLDPFARGMHGVDRSSRMGLAKGQSALIYALRAKASSQAAHDYLVGNAGQHVVVAVHYNAKVWRETTLNLLLREQLLLGTPLLMRELLAFGVFIVPNALFYVPEDHERVPIAIGDGKVGVALTAQGREIADSSVTLSLVGLLIGPGQRIVDEDRFEKLLRCIPKDAR